MTTKIAPIYPKRCMASGHNIYKVMAVVGGQRYRFRGTYDKAMAYAEKVNIKIAEWNERQTQSAGITCGDNPQPSFSASRRLSF